MSQQENPYRAPDTSTTAADATVPVEELIRRGRLIFFAIVAYFILSDVGICFVLGYDLKIGRLVLVGFLFLAIWRGYGWSRVVLGLVFAIGIPFVLALIIRSFGEMRSYFLVLNLLILGCSTLISATLFFSKSLKAYCKRKSPTTVNLTAREDPSVLPDDPTGKELFTVATFDHRAMADVCRVAIEQEGIEVFMADDHLVGLDFFLSNALRGIKVQVVDTDARRAMEIWNRTKPAVEANESGDESDVDFDCEECGKPLSFPGRRRGHVETCPHCGEYVDVPERE